MDKNCVLCPWVQDAENPNRYVCLKCRREKNIDRLNIPAPIWFVLAAIFGLILQTTILDKPAPIKTPSSPSSIYDNSR
ncbi:hypothetical protein NG798_08605 [Ancylothrix sp. C2]|uniref:hypothetical protein n=1 Tax=Ancylothrix sp. D3o TaxID=2953691 RepID=UPI0021BAD423|nr:hypothetical protein [Ancylothrix sp. D3o]MCT7949845.1 hypothetical protein [Ancylothrix sp. D3o]